VVGEAGSIDVSFNLISHPYTPRNPEGGGAAHDPSALRVILALGGPGDRSAPLWDY